MTNSAILLVSCPDRKGLVATITDFIFRHNGNILHFDQHVDSEESIFFMRAEWDLTQFALPREEVAPAFQAIADQFQMQWELRFSDYVPRMAVFVSKQTHCFYDIIARYQSGEWQVEIPLIISNHPDLEPIASKFGIPFHVFKVNAANKAEQEAAQLALLAQHQVDFMVLARYMQILSDDFVRHYPNRVINIHHSFLPAFAGAKPYHSAYQRGVKLIGATSHYVTAELDAGPIIEQDVMRVNHKDSIKEMIRKGQDVEKLVLAQAIWNHIQNRVLIYNNKTVVFS